MLLFRENNSEYCEFVGEKVGNNVAKGKKMPKHSQFYGLSNKLYSTTHWESCFNFFIARHPVG
jgi:hypothetical protein